MKRRILGKTGFSVSEVGLGCWQLGGDFGPVSQEVARDILTSAWDHGVNFWDTADVYGAGLSENIIGQWRKENREAQQLVVATKIGRTDNLYPDGYTKASVRDNITQNLKRLGGESLDLVQLHCVPPEVLKDGEIFTWLQDYKREGLIQHYGASVETIEEGLCCLQDDELATIQTIFNIFRQDALTELLPKAQEKNVGIIVRLPLASGLLTGKFNTDHKFDETDHRNFNCDGQAFSVGETFSGVPFKKGVELARHIGELVPDGTTMAQFALRWILDQPGVSSVIPGATRPEQIFFNSVASELPSLSEETIAELARFYKEEVKPFVRGNV